MRYDEGYDRRILSKRLKSNAGEIEVNVPRDRNGEYEPQVIKKHQNTIGQDLEAKIIYMYIKLVILNLIAYESIKLIKWTIFPLY